jgi:hypothetical protein
MELCIVSVSAMEVKGYIISNTQDTIFGSVKLTDLDLINNTIILNSYNMDDLLTQVFFKPDSHKRFKWYTADDIQEYFFIIKNAPYRFISRDVKTILSKKDKKYFYLQIVHGAIDLYERRIMLYDNDIKFHPHSVKIKEYYVQGEDGILIKTSKTSQYKTVFELLSGCLKSDVDLLHKAIGDKSFHDIVEIIHLYNQYMQESTHSGLLY